MNTNQNTCKSCRKKLVGRSDKKFCNVHCRNFYHNATNQVSPAESKISSILRKNRRILIKLHKEAGKILNNAQLQAEGFNFHYFTHIEENQNGEPCFFCFDHGYLPTENNYIAIVSKGNGTNTQERHNL